MEHQKLWIRWRRISRVTGEISKVLRFFNGPSGLDLYTVFSLFYYDFGKKIFSFFITIITSHCFYTLLHIILTLDLTRKGGAISRFQQEGFPLAWRGHYMGHGPVTGMLLLFILFIYYDLDKNMKNFIFSKSCDLKFGLICNLFRIWK
jgi:hypothetical protein